MPIPVVVPRMGLTMTDGTVMRWLKNEGDPVTKGEPVLELMTDKVTMEVEAPASGVLSKILHGQDAVVPVGEALALISTADEAKTTPAPSTAPRAESPKVTPVAQRMAAEHKIELHKVRGTGEGGMITKQDLAAHLASVPVKEQTGEPEAVRASPAARRAARELGIDLATLSGTGPEGRITEDDVRRAEAERMAAPARVVTHESEPLSSAPQPKGVPVTSSVPVRGIRQVIAERMTQSFQTTPHFYLTVELDATALLDLHNRFKAKGSNTDSQVSVTDLLTKFVAIALAEHPFANARWQEGKIEMLGQVNIGIATATEQGLVVPVIKGADRLPIQEIARARQELVARARSNKLSLEDVSDATFTMSNLGMYGVDLFSGIINPPQSALLAVGRIKERPVGVNGEIRLRPTMYVTLSVDHRVMDGAQAAILLQRMSELVEQPALLVL